MKNKSPRKTQPCPKPAPQGGNGVPQACADLDEIARRAYDLWEREGKPQGRDFDHWVEAEAHYRACCEVVADADDTEA